MTTPSRFSHAGRFSLRIWADRPLAEPSLLYGPLHFLTRLVLITISEFNRNSLSLRSGAMTYTVLLSLVPVLALSTAVVKGLGGGDQLRKAAYTYVESLEESPSLLPKDLLVEKIPNNLGEIGATLTDHLRSAIDQLFDYVDKTDFSAIGTFGVLGILLSVILVLSNIESAMNTIWKVPDGRSVLRKIADYLTLLILMPLSINVAFAASALLKNPTLASHVDVFIPFPWMQALLLNALPVAFIAVTFYVMYLFFPNTRVRTRPAVLGAVLAAVLWFGVQNIYISLQIGVSRYNAIYGSFATLPLFLVWIYLGWIFILTGAQVAYAAQHIMEYSIVPLVVTPSLRLSLAFDIMDRIYYNFTEAQPTTKDNLTDFLSAYPAQQVAEVVDVLEKSGIVYASQSGERLLPATPLERYDTKVVIDTILGADVPDTAGGKMSREALAAAAAASRKRNETAGSNEEKEDM